jgi:hypothetical protein
MTTVSLQMNKPDHPERSVEKLGYATNGFGLGTRSRYFVSNQRGVALVIALVMLLVLTLIGISSVSMSTYESTIAGNERLYNLAFYTADGGVENFRAQVSSGMFIYSALNTGSYQVTIGGNPCTVSYSRWTRSDAGGSYADFKVTAVGQAPFPAQGSVVVESIIEAPMMTPQGYDGGN